MKTFLEFHKETLGVKEYITFPKFPELGEVQAKVDTGNEAYNVLHGVDIKDVGKEVTFTTVNNRKITLTKIDEIKIHIGSGVKEDRPVVLIDFVMNGKEYKMFPFSIADRSENNEPVLLGEPFLRKTGSVVDPNKDSD
ncbi:hypothetical protein EBR43_12520 [bacterium]|nr:hypothetical protein [bacterium]